MFCSKCGHPVDDGAAVCGNCGSAVENPGASGGDIVAPKGKSLINLGNFNFSSINFRDPKIIGIIAAGVAVILLLSLVFGGQSYKGAVNNMLDGIFDGNGSKMMKAIPDGVIEAMAEEAGMSKREITSYMEEELGEMVEELDYYIGDNWSISHKIVGTDSYDFDEVRDIKETYDEIGVNVKEAKIVEVELTIKAFGMTQTTDMEIGVIKVGGSWYVDVENFDMDFLY